MIRYLAALAIAAFVSVSAWGKTPFLLRNDPIGSAFAPSCSQSSAFLARATGVMLTADKQNYDTLICGLVTDGVFSQLYVLYVYLAPDSTTALLNLISSSFNGAITGSLTFTAYQGYTGDASTGFVSTGFNPATQSVNQNAYGIGGYVQSSRTTAQNWAIGGQDAGNFTLLSPLQGANVTSYAINSASVPTTAGSNAQGAWSVERTGATTTTLYHTGSSVTTDATASGTVDNTNLTSFAINTGSGFTSFSGDQISGFWATKGLSGPQSASLYSRIHTFNGAYGRP